MDKDNFEPSNTVGRFYIYVPGKSSLGGNTMLRRISYKIDNDIYDNEEYNPQILFDALIEGKDVIFSLNNGEFIFTIHGEGFAEIVDSLPELVPEWELEPD